MFEKMNAKFWSPTGAPNPTETDSKAICEVDGQGKIVRETTVASEPRWPGLRSSKYCLAARASISGVHGPAGRSVMEGARNRLAS